MLGRNWIESPWGRMLVVFETSKPAFVRLWLPDSSAKEQLRSLNQDKKLCHVEELPIPRSLVSWVKKIQSYFAGKSCDFKNIPLDLQLCTDFQRKVLSELMKIESGQTLSYAEISRRLGTRGYQAVGSAVGSNPVPLLIPCHRVLATGGAPGGFSSPGGLKTKQRMLALEGIDLFSSRPVTFFDKDFNPAKAKRELAKLDSRLAKVIKIAPDFNPGKSRPEAPLRALAKSIVYQQLSGKAAATIWGRVVDLCGKNLERASSCSHEELRSAGLSNNKARALSELVSRNIPSLALFKKMSDQQVIDEISSYRGLGAWSAQMFLIFNLGRMDVFAPADLGLQKGRCEIFKLNMTKNEKELELWARKFSPHRTLLSWYLWRSLEL